MLVNRCCNFWKQKCDRERKEKILKHKDFITGIQRILNVKGKMKPVIRGATGTISEILSTCATCWESTKLRNCKNSHIWHRTFTAEGANVTVQNVNQGKWYNMSRKL